MAYKLILTLDEDMDAEDAKIIALELEDHDGVAEVDGFGDFRLWDGDGE